MIAERVAFFIDGLNFFHGVRLIDKLYTDFKFDFERYVKHIVGKRQFVAGFYYNAPLKLQLNPRLYSQQQRFFARLGRFLNVVLCKRQKRTTKDGPDSYIVKGDDIHLAIDAMRLAYENKFDTLVLISGDGDFAPLVREIKKLSRKVELCYFNQNISLDLLNQFNKDERHLIDKKTLNQFFFRGHNQI